MLMAVNTMPVQELSFLESVAKSQVVWALVALGLAFVGYKAFRAYMDRLQAQNEKREEQLFSLYEKQAEESKAREEKLMAHVEKTTDTMDDISNALHSLQVANEKTNSRVDKIFDILDKSKSDGR